jgi:hypothetical protein
MSYTFTRKSQSEVHIVNDSGQVECICSRGSHSIWRLFARTEPVTSLPGEYHSAEQAFNAFLEYLETNKIAFAAMMKDERYSTVKKLISSKQLSVFREIFEIVPKSVVARDLGMTNRGVERLTHRVEDFALKDLFKFADFLEIDRMDIIQMVYAQYIADETNRK